MLFTGSVGARTIRRHQNVEPERTADMNFRLLTAAALALTLGVAGCAQAPLPGMAGMGIEEDGFSALAKPVNMEAVTVARGWASTEEALSAIPRSFPISLFREPLKSFLKENFESKSFPEPTTANSFEVRKDSIEAGYL